MSGGRGCDPAVSLPGSPPASFLLGAELDRKRVLDFIRSSSRYGNLGAFIGAGFSKAVFEDGGEKGELSWGELLCEASAKMGVDFSSVALVGQGYPEIASAICHVHSGTNGCEYRVSLGLLKEEIASLTRCCPCLCLDRRYAGFLEYLDLAWIITTNYDLVIESLLQERAIPLGPNDALSSRRGTVPVYHLHGLCTRPGEIIIAQEDYIALFRPGEYRQIKLALILWESTTLILGYGLGDVNVLTALDWSGNVFRGEPVTYPHAVIQVLRKDAPRELPYRDRNNIVIVESPSLSSFFQELTGA